MLLQFAFICDGDDDVDGIAVLASLQLPALQGRGVVEETR